MTECWRTCEAYIQDGCAACLYCDAYLDPAFDVLAWVESLNARKESKPHSFEDAMFRLEAVSFRLEQKGRACGELGMHVLQAEMEQMVNIIGEEVEFLRAHDRQQVNLMHERQEQASRTMLEVALIAARKGHEEMNDGQTDPAS